MRRPSIVVSPHPRTMAEIFETQALSRLHELADVVWGSDEPMPQDLFVDAIARATAVAVGAWPYDRDVVHHAGEDLRAIFEVLGTHDHPRLDYATCFEQGIAVGSIAPVFGPVVAEMCLALALAARRGLSESDRAFRSGTERYLHAGTVGSRSLIGATVGFVGCGGLSRSLQGLLAPFDVTLLGYDPWLGPDTLTRRGIRPADLVEIFAASDVVFVLAVPTPENEGMISRSLLELLGRSDVLVIGSRSHLVDFDAVTEFVSAGRFRAGIDVFPTEPLPVDHPIRHAESAVLTAHIAGALPDTLHGIGEMIVDDLEAIVAGRVPTRMQYATPDLIAALRRRSGSPG